QLRLHLIFIYTLSLLDALPFCLFCAVMQLSHFRHAAEINSLQTAFELTIHPEANPPTNRHLRNLTRKQSMTQRKKNLSLAMIAAAGITLAAPAMARDTIQIAGSSTVLPFASIVAEEFGNSFP